MVESHRWTATAAGSPPCTTRGGVECAPRRRKPQFSLTRGSRPRRAASGSETGKGPNHYHSHDEGGASRPIVGVCGRESGNWRRCRFTGLRQHAGRGADEPGQGGGHDGQEGHPPRVRGERQGAPLARRRIPNVPAANPPSGGWGRLAQSLWRAARSNGQREYRAASLLLTTLVKAHFKAWPLER